MASRTNVHFFATMSLLPSSKVQRRRRCSVASVLFVSTLLIGATLQACASAPSDLPKLLGDGYGSSLPLVACAAAAAGTPVSPSLPEVLPAVQTLPDEDVTKDDDDERIEHVTPKSKVLPQEQGDIIDDNFVQEDENRPSAIDEEAWREQLPHQLQQRRGTLHRLLVPMPNASSSGQTTNDVVEIYLLGTSHVSKDSCDDARLLVEHICPDVLFIELCHQRLALLADDPADPSHELERDGSDEQVTGELQKQPKAEKQSRGMSWSAGMLTRIQQDYATKLGVKIGGEFREAYGAAARQQKAFEEEMNRHRFGLVDPAIASSVGPITVILGDRPVRLTILRAWESLRLFGKAKLCLGLLWSSLRPPSEKELKEWMDKIMNDPTNDLLTDSIAELSKHFPQIGRTIIDERDDYMVCKLKQTVNLLGNAPSVGRRRRIVAVVGAGHCPGILQRLKDTSDTTNTEEKIQALIQGLIETKKWKVEDPHIRSLVTDVTQLQIGPF